MSKLIISGEIDGAAMEFAQAILSDLEGHGWLKRAIRECLRHDPEQAHDETLLLHRVMAMRVGETVGDEN